MTRRIGGWKAIVAIADVSFYVRPGTALDSAARARGNSVYFPDRVVPMLPEELSADICSLKEGQERAALACHLTIAKDGTVKSWRFTRARIRVAANIAYEDAQAAIDAAEEEPIDVASPVCSMPPVEGAVPKELVETALKPLWGCWRALARGAQTARARSSSTLPERRVVLDEKGRIASIAPRERLDCAPAGRGFHDRRQRRRCPCARSEEGRRSCTASTSRRAARSSSRSRTISRPSRSSSRSAR